MEMEQKMMMDEMAVKWKEKNGMKVTKEDRTVVKGMMNLVILFDIDLEFVEYH
jgi:hypothetical protein